jgi:8-oxo-dGTP diphosphatase
MAISPYLKGLRDRVGGDLLLLPSVAVMAFDGRGRLLLVRATDTGQWQTVGGAIDPGETPAEAALREAVEETGLEVELVRVIGCYGGPLFRFAYPNGHLCEYVATVFEARPRGGAVRPGRRGDERGRVVRGRGRGRAYGGGAHAVPDRRGVPAGSGDAVLAGGAGRPGA